MSETTPTNYEKYFGTPELASDMLTDHEIRTSISLSFFRHFRGIEDEWNNLKTEEKYAYVHEWMEGEAGA